MWTERLKETLAITMIGDGLLSFLVPRRHALLWRTGPSFLEELDGWLADNPGVLRVLGVAEAGVGLWLALRQYEEQ